MKLRAQDRLRASARNDNLGGTLIAVIARLTLHMCSVQAQSVVAISGTIGRAFRYRSE
jgi:hypothetical protein